MENDLAVTRLLWEGKDEACACIKKTVVFDRIAAGRWLVACAERQRVWAQSVTDGDPLTATDRAAGPGHPNAHRNPDASAQPDVHTDRDGYGSSHADRDTHVDAHVDAHRRADGDGLAHADGHGDP